MLDKAVKSFRALSVWMLNVPLTVVRPDKPFNDVMLWLLLMLTLPPTYCSGVIPVRSASDVLLMFRLPVMHVV